MLKRLTRVIVGFILAITLPITILPCLIIWILSGKNYLLMTSEWVLTGEIYYNLLYQNKNKLKCQKYSQK